MEGWPMSYEGLKAFATETQRKYIDAIKSAGSIRAAGRALRVADTTIGASLRTLQRKAAREGMAPGHFESGVAPGYLMGKVTVQRGASGAVERTWERQSPEQTAMMDAIKEAYAAMAQELPRVPPTGFTAATDDKLATLYTLTDSHVGMLAWAEEGGADWDLQIAEATLVGCFAQMVRASPAAKIGFVNQLGDFLHYDSAVAPVTPQSGHVLDADGRFPKMVSTAVRVLRRVVGLALEKHEQVVLLLAEGNHDMGSSVWLRVMFKALYEDEPRVTVIDSALPYYTYQHGKTMLAFHHGHLKKNDQLPILFAAQFPKIWGVTTKRYAHCGHRHHVEEKEHSGMTVIQHATLAARDAYAARGGWISERSVTAITYHSEYGQVARNTVTPEMLG
jgi:hypothetical protein